MSTSHSNSAPSRHRRFRTTSWSVVVKAAAVPSSSDSQRREALSELCQTYWYPLYAFLRQSWSRSDAEEITQEFFADLLRGEKLKMADQTRGRFRTFLLTAARNFSANYRRRQNAKKRGGEVTILSFDFESAEGRFALEPVDHVTPQLLFERSWALTLLERTCQLLEQHYVETGKGELFDSLKPFVQNEQSVPFADLAAKLGKSEGALKVAVHRMRSKWRDILREEIGHTVDDPKQIDHELAELFRVFSDPD